MNQFKEASVNEKSSVFWRNYFACFMENANEEELYGKKMSNLLPNS